ncbi:MAG: HAMP domain-containing protein [Deltaproteobacteria bacterium]|nr:HAMP domain-containing protein [Deltaproteobacteria bacterium]
MPFDRARNLPIHIKLIALIATSMVVVVGSMAVFLSSRQLDEIHAGLSTRAAMYADIMAASTMSAVAFADRETAREELRSLDADQQVVAVALYTEGGELLYARGRADTPFAAVRGLVTPRRVEHDGRIAAAAPVVSVEGPRGVVVIEVSTAALDASRGDVIEVALIAGGAVLLAGIVLAWLIARRFASRLRAIGVVAEAVAKGDMSLRPVADGSRDEIGALATGFDAMLAEIHRLLEREKQLAAEEQARLEALVAQRTRELDRRNAEMRLVLDHVEQGLLTVDLDGTIAPEQSAAVERMLGKVPASRSIEELVRTVAPPAADWFALQWEALREELLPVELCIAQLPSTLEVGARAFDLAYAPLVDGDGRTRVLVVITDVTARRAREAAERDERELSALIGRLLASRAGFLAFREEARQLVAQIARGHGDASYRRAVHTLKGIAGFEGLGSIAAACHRLEDALAEGDEVGARAHRNTILERWEHVASKLEALAMLERGHVEVCAGDLARIEAAIARGAPHRELAELVGSWRHERATTRLERFADDARALALRLGKDVTVAVEASDDLRLPGERFAPFWGAFTHLVRNAVDHGVEVPAARTAHGKAAQAHLVLRARRAGDQIAIEISDDGGGIDWARVAAAAEKQGLPAATHDELVAGLFHDGVTTREAVSATSGRGVGMAAVREACEATGGRIAIASERDRGTTISVVWTDPAARLRTVSGRHSAATHARSEDEPAA